MEIMKSMISCAKNSNKSCEDEKETIKKIYIKGTVVLMKKSVLDPNGASILDRVYEIIGKRVSIQLISATLCDPRNGSNGVIGKAASLENWETKMKPTADGGEASFWVTFEWEEAMGVPGAFLISNELHTQFYLKSVTLEDVPDEGTLHFVCNSWVYPTYRYKNSRIFFANKAYLPGSTPEALRHYREQELITLRGDSSGTLNEWDRVYDYAFYNDLGLPDKGIEHARPVLGGSWEYPYPRRGRTGRRPTKRDPNTEDATLMFVYVPPDERFSHAKYADFSRNAAKPLLQMIQLFGKNSSKEFDTFGDIMKLYEDVNFRRARRSLRQNKKQHNHFKLANQLLGSGIGKPVMFPKPDVIKANMFAWRTDEEFGREMLAGVNPVVIRRLEEFPPASKLDPEVYGNQTSSMTKEHIEENMNGLTVEQALEENKLFILDHHDAWFPYLKRINSTQSKMYATRTLLLLQDDSTLKPLAIELSLPSVEENHGCISNIYTPAENDDDVAESMLWQFAKAYAVVNDSGYHQMISHWLNTHAVIEPFVIATNRQLSVLHPIYKLIKPHFRDTMNINALTRKMFINAGGSFERTISSGKYSMEMSSSIYKDWVFGEQALPADLLKRGVAVKDPREPHGLRLLIEDYPFAVDGLEIWSAIQIWVDEYCCIYYPSEEIVKCDSELQSWWMELKTKGHGDKKDEPWWPQMQTRAELIDTCTIIIWVASALHAAVSLGQYPYAGYTPNRPCISRRFMPQTYEVESDPDKTFLKTFTSRYHTVLGLSLMEILSMHATDEIYLGENESPYWTSDNNALEAFERFGKKMVEIEERIMKRNKDERLKNRNGPVKVPYTLLCPNTSDHTRTGGLMGKGIPNSISI